MPSVKFAALTTGLAVTSALGWVFVGKLATLAFPTVDPGSLVSGSAVFCAAAYVANAVNARTHNPQPTAGR